jgi:hypothetical protein
MRYQMRIIKRIHHTAFNVFHNDIATPELVGEETMDTRDANDIMVNESVDFPLVISLIFSDSWSNLDNGIIRSLNDKIPFSASANNAIRGGFQAKTYQFTVR